MVPAGCKLGRRRCSAVAEKDVACGGNEDKRGKKNGRVEKDEDGKEIKYEQKGTGAREEIERVEHETKRKRGGEKTNT